MREFLRELAAVAVGALVYYLVRGAVADRASEAFQRARDILELERRLRLDWETTIHEAILGSDALIDFANGAYFWGHMPLLVLLALWLWRSHRDIWSRFRNALLLSAAIGLISYLLFPTAPPRADARGWGISTPSPSAPRPPTRRRKWGCSSIHMRRYRRSTSAGRCWPGLAVWHASKHPAMRTFAVAIPLSQAWAVVATANHWTLDAVAGLTVCGVAWLVTVQVDRIRRKRTHRATGR